MPENKLKQ